MLEKKVTTVLPTYWQLQRERSEERELQKVRKKLRRIRSPWNRFLVSKLIDVLIVTAPVFDDLFDRDWTAARDMQKTASLRTHDFFTTLTAPARYRRMYLRAMMITWKNTLRLYRVVLGTIWENFWTVAFS